MRDSLYPDTVHCSMDSIFHVFQLEHLEYPIQLMDRILASRYPTQLYCCRLSSDLCALNQSDVSHAAKR